MNKNEIETKPAVIVKRVNHCDPRNPTIIVDASHHHLDRSAYLRSAEYREKDRADRLAAMARVYPEIAELIEETNQLKQERDRLLEARAKLQADK